MKKSSAARIIAIVLLVLQGIFIMNDFSYYGTMYPYGNPVSIMNIIGYYFIGEIGLALLLIDNKERKKSKSADTTVKSEISAVNDTSIQKDTKGNSGVTDAESNNKNVETQAIADSKETSLQDFENVTEHVLNKTINIIEAEKMNIITDTKENVIVEKQRDVIKPLSVSNPDTKTMKRQIDKDLYFHYVFRNLIVPVLIFFITGFSITDYFNGFFFTSVMFGLCVALLIAAYLGLKRIQMYGKCCLLAACITELMRLIIFTVSLYQLKYPNANWYAAVILPELFVTVFLFIYYKDKNENTLINLFTNEQIIQALKHACDSCVETTYTALLKSQIIGLGDKSSEDRNKILLTARNSYYSAVEKEVLADICKDGDLVDKYYKALTSNKFQSLKIYESENKNAGNIIMVLVDCVGCNHVTKEEAFELNQYQSSSLNNAVDEMLGQKDTLTSKCVKDIQCSDNEAIPLSDIAYALVKVFPILGESFLLLITLYSITIAGYISRLNNTEIHGGLPITLGYIIFIVYFSIPIFCFVKAPANSVSRKICLIYSTCLLVWLLYQYRAVSVATKIYLIIMVVVGCLFGYVVNRKKEVHQNV